MSPAGSRRRRGARTGADLISDLTPSLPPSAIAPHPNEPPPETQQGCREPPGAVVSDNQTVPRPRPICHLTRASDSVQPTQRDRPPAQSIEGSVGVREDAWRLGVWFLDLLLVWLMVKGGQKAVRVQPACA